jgi:hypothetical protein
MVRAEARIAQLRSTATEPRTLAAIGYPPDYTDSSSKNEKLAQTAFQEQGLLEKSCRGIIRMANVARVA